MNYLLQLSESIKELMLYKNYSAKVLAEVTSIKVSRIYDFINAVHFPSVSNALKLATAFDCSVDYLFGLSEKKLFNTPPNNLNKHERLVKQFDTCKLSRYKISKLLNIGEPQLARWYSGACVPQLASLLALCEIFHCSLEYLIID